MRLAARLLAGVLDRAHPLWRVWFVTGLPDGRVAVVVKVHHVLADGLAAIHLITSMFGAKRVAHRHGGKVNDVVLSLATAGVRTLLRSRAEPVDGLWLHASVAVSTRTPGQAAEPGNRTGGMLVRLPCGEPDPGTRLAGIAVQSARAKSSQLYSAGNALLVWLARLGIAGWFSRRQRMVHLVESNVAGPSSPITVLGVPVLDLIPIGNLAGNLAISFLAVSYAGQLVITVQADADHFPDLPVLVSAMWRDWAALSGCPSDPQVA